MDNRSGRAARSDADHLAANLVLLSFTPHSARLFLHSRSRSRRPTTSTRNGLIIVIPATFGWPITLR
jgi:hypothetical protein